MTRRGLFSAIAGVVASLCVKSPEKVLLNRMPITPVESITFRDTSGKTLTVHSAVMEFDSYEGGYVFDKNGNVVEYHETRWLRKG